MMTTDAATALPALTGSAKQVAWAEQIRVKVLAELASTLAGLFQQSLVAGQISVAQADALMVQNEAIMRQMTLRHTDAAWWISVRETSVLVLLKQEARAQGVGQ